MVKGQGQLRERWYSIPNDLIGGYSVMNCDKPPSQADHHKGEWEIACFIFQEHADHIAELHNQWLDDPKGEVTN